MGRFHIDKKKYAGPVKVKSDRDAENRVLKNNRGTIDLKKMNGWGEFVQREGKTPYEGRTVAFYDHDNKRLYPRRGTMKTSEPPRQTKSPQKASPKKRSGGFGFGLGLI
ncbi:hypothetical protein [Methanocella sp. MCL-LM]|uniref:hypothetical protein n=1 Tax=Methanocella sp. MCL-LM TaxID=3412035 RepID=UPI003C762909